MTGLLGLHWLMAHKVLFVFDNNHQKTLFADIFYCVFEVQAI